jgi:hypothetical protein
MDENKIKEIDALLAKANKKKEKINIISTPSGVRTAFNIDASTYRQLGSTLPNPTFRREFQVSYAGPQLERIPPIDYETDLQSRLSVLQYDYDQARAQMRGPEELSSLHSEINRLERQIRENQQWLAQNVWRIEEPQDTHRQHIEAHAQLLATERALFQEQVREEAERIETNSAYRIEAVQNLLEHNLISNEDAFRVLTSERSDGSNSE